MRGAASAFCSGRESHLDRRPHDRRPPSSAGDGWPRRSRGKSGAFSALPTRTPRRLHRGGVCHGALAQASRTARRAGDRDLGVGRLVRAQGREAALPTRPPASQRRSAQRQLSERTHDGRHRARDDDRLRSAPRTAHLHTPGSRARPGRPRDHGSVPRDRRRPLGD
jgi:hypothetical protein